RSRIGTLQSVAVGSPTVAARRRPSALAAMELYFSTPKLIRRVALRTTSSAHSHGPAPLESRATYNTVVLLIGVGYATGEFWCVSRSGIPPAEGIRQRSISFTIGFPLAK